MRLRFPFSFSARSCGRRVRIVAGRAQSPQQARLDRAAERSAEVARGDRRINLDTLFEALKIAPDDGSAKAIEDRIWTLWISSGSDTCNLLMSRVKSATDSKDYDLAIKLLDAIIEIKPDYVEAWNRRATVYYMKKDFAPFACRHPAGAVARAAPFRRAGRASA